MDALVSAVYSCTPEERRPRMTPLQQADLALERAITLYEATSRFIRTNPVSDYSVFFDEAMCDGACLADDCESARDESAHVLAALRAAKNQPDAGAVVDACEAALEPFARFGQYLQDHPRHGLSEMLYSWDGRDDIGVTKTALREANSAAAAIRAYRESQPGPWRGIESAPKDGTKILAINNRCNQCVCLFMEGKWHSMFSSGPSSFINGGCGSVLTHWMPLAPPPPAQEGGAA